MADENKKLDPDKDEETPQDEGSFADESLLSFIEVPDESTSAGVPEEEAKPEPLPEPPSPLETQSPGGVTVDEVLAKREELDIDIDMSGAKPESPPAEAPEIEPPPVGDETTAKSGFLEIHSPRGDEGKWKVETTNQVELDARIRASHLQPLGYSPEGKVRVDHERLAKLDNELKNELERLREKSLEGVIPGEFLQARHRLEAEGILECPRCKIKVPDTPGKIDYCPQCGLGIDDYLGQFRRDWEQKYKHQKSAGLKIFAPQVAKPGKTRWEEWKEEKGVDPEAELLICPVCGMGVYDDPFVATKCPECKIPLDLHLQFPREYVRKREASSKGRRWESLKAELENKKKGKK